MKNFAENEPVVTVTTIVGAIMAALIALVSLNVFNLTEDQLNAIEGALVAIVPLFFIGAGFIARQFVVPVAKLEDAGYDIEIVGGADALPK